MENKTDSTSYKRPGRKSLVIISFFLILIGIFFIGINMGLLPNNFNKVIFSWQMVVILIGLINLFRGKFFSSLIFLFTGGFFILPRLANVFPDTFYWVTDNFISTYWPVLLIGAGVLLLLYWIIKPKHQHAKCHTSRKSKHKKEYVYSYPHSGFQKSSVFGSGEHIILDPVFNGGSIDAVFGGIVLDLRKTTLPEGNTFLEINAVFGGITVFVPETWNVEFSLDAVFGGFTDNRNINTEIIDNSRKLIIQGACVFGGGELKN